MREVFIPHPETCPPSATEVSKASVFASPETDRQKPHQVEVPNTTICVDQQNLDRLRPVIEMTLGFAGMTSRMVGESYIDCLQAYLKRERNIPFSSVPSLIESQQMHLPEFEIFDNHSGQEFLSDTRYAHRQIDPRNILLVFNLPHLSTEIWRKAGTHPKRSDKKIAKQTIWGRLGTETIDIFNDTARLYMNRGSLQFDRINNRGMHDFELYYYLIEIHKPGQKRNQSFSSFRR